MIKVSGPVAYFDVDDTLVWWDNNDPESTLSDLELDITEFEFEFNGKKLKRYYIHEHLREIQLQKEAGTNIVVWSKSGAEWAEAIVKALGVDEYVDVVTSKPDRIYDDKDSSEWMPKRRYYV